MGAGSAGAWGQVTPAPHLPEGGRDWGGGPAPGGTSGEGEVGGMFSLFQTMVLGCLSLSCLSKKVVTMLCAVFLAVFCT